MCAKSATENTPITPKVIDSPDLTDQLQHLKYVFKKPLLGVCSLFICISLITFL